MNLIAKLCLLFLQYALVASKALLKIVLLLLVNSKHWFKLRERIQSGLNAEIPARTGNFQPKPGFDLIFFQNNDIVSSYLTIGLVEKHCL